MPNSRGLSAGSSPCRIEWRPSRLLCAALLLIALLAALAVLMSEMPRVVAWPLAALAVVHGSWLAWIELRRPRRWFAFSGQDGPVRVDGRVVQAASVTWRGPLAFVRWRDGAGRTRRLGWWPDVLTGDQRRELRLAAPVRRAARQASSVAP